VAEQTTESTFTPRTIDVRCAYAVAGQTQNLYDYAAAIRAGSSRFGAEFDRWLAAHDQEVAARAWDEGPMGMTQNAGATMSSTEEAARAEAERRPVDLSEAAVEAAARVLLADYETQYAAEHITWKDFAELARAALQAAIRHGTHCNPSMGRKPIGGE